MTGAWLFILVAVFGWAFWSFSEKKALQSGTPWQTLFVSLAIKTVLALPLAGLFLYTMQGQSGFGISSKVWTWMLAAMILNGVAIILFRFILLKRGVGITMALVETSPVVTAFLAFIFLNESLTFFQSMGILFTISGAILINKT